MEDYAAPQQSAYITNRPSDPVAMIQSTDMSSATMVTAELTRFMLRKDLLFSRLSNINDRPESYCSWKCSFKNVMRELQVLDSEGMDLLVKYLGPESRKHAESIRSSNLNNMEEGLRRLWLRPDERYRSPEMVEAAIKNRLMSFPKLTSKENAKRFDLADILAEMMFLKEDLKYRTLFSYLDSSSGIKPIISKLPYFLQGKWTTRAARYKRERNVKEFVEYIQEISRIRNDPSFMYDSSNTEKPTDPIKTRISARKTGVEEDHSQKDHPKCLVHIDQPVRHDLMNCRKFKSKPITERMMLLKQHRVCFRCAASTYHRKAECKAKLKCKDGGSDRHPTALHVSVPTSETRASKDDGGETFVKKLGSPALVANCTEIYKGQFGGKSCARILPVKVVNCTSSLDIYAVLDDQSNRTLAKKELFDRLSIQSQPVEYLLNSCSGQVKLYGRTGAGLMIESVDGQTQMCLPTVIECDNLPDNLSEIPTQEAVSYHPHLQEIVRHIKPIDTSRQILLLIGRDLIRAHHVLHQRIGPDEAPFTQKTPLGWTIIGDVCLEGRHIPKVASTYRTFISSRGRASILEPCTQNLKVKECVPRTLLSGDHEKDRFHDSKLFERTTDDNKVGTSVEDRLFLDLMEKEMFLGEDGTWMAPLPFRSPRRRLPNNYRQALRRARSLEASLRRDPSKREHFITCMQKLFNNDHEEVAPPLEADMEQWYLPLFGVYHPRKPDQIRGVFDSSVREDGISLNDVLLSGQYRGKQIQLKLPREQLQESKTSPKISSVYYLDLDRK